MSEENLYESRESLPEEGVRTQKPRRLQGEDDSQTVFRFTFWAFVLVGGLALLPYPILAIGAIMSLAGKPDASGSQFSAGLGQLFFLMILAYPLPYCLSMAMAFVCFKRSDQQSAMLWAIAPLIWIAVGACLFIFLLTSRP